jgi:hypothetical protein
MCTVVGTMERTAWTDERLDDLSGRMDLGFERVDRRFEQVDCDIRDLRMEMRAGFDSLQTTMTRFGAAMIVCLLGTIVAVALGGS